MSSNKKSLTIHGYLTVLLLILAWSCPIHAQSTLSQNQDGFNGETMDGFMNMDPDKDSTVIERTVSKDYWQWTIDPDTGLPDSISLDTVHHSFHNVHLNEGMLGTYSHLGNMGSPRISRLYFERAELNDFIFDAPYDYWIKNPDRFRFTDAKSPHITIDYYKGGNKRTGEEHLKGYFTTNFNKRVGLGFDLDYQLGRGRYTNSATSMFDARVYTYYRGDLYHIYATANRDEIKITENGGIQDERYITNPEAMAEGRKSYSPEDIPFRLYENWNNIKRKQALVNQELTIRTTRIQTDSIGDTAITYHKERVFGKLAHTLEIGRLQRRYLFYQNTDGFYPKSYLYNDSIDNMRNFYISNTLSLSLAEGATQWAIAGLTGYVSHRFNRFAMPDTLSTGDEYMRRYNENNLYVGAILEKAHGDNLTFNAHIESCLLGDNLGEMSLNGQMQLRYPVLKQDAGIGAYASMRVTPSPFFMSQFHSTFAWWDKDFNKTVSTRFGGYIDLEKTRTRLQLDAENIANYIYLKNDAGAYTNKDTIQQPSYSISAAQHTGSIQVLSFTLQQNFKLGPLHWDNNLTYQLSGNQDIIPLPALNIFTDLYFKFIYYKRLHMEVGANALYFTKYAAPGYCPAVGMYHLQNDGFKQEVGGYPLMTAYVNCYLRGMRFYFMYYHLNDGKFNNRSSFMVPGYPANPAMFKFGLSWTLFD